MFFISLIYSKEGLGVEINLSRKLRNDELLFGECQSVIIVSIEERYLHDLVLLAKKINIHTQTIGKVTNDGELRINDKVSLAKDAMSKAYFNSLEEMLES